jgi:hypothetical protein
VWYTEQILIKFSVLEINEVRINGLRNFGFQTLICEDFKESLLPAMTCAYYSILFCYWNVGGCVRYQHVMINILDNYVKTHRWN